MTINTSTSYLECSALTLGALFDFADGVREYFRRQREQMEKGGG